MDLRLRALLRRDPACVYCRDVILADADRIDCPDCRVPMHAECQEEMLRCATVGCEGFARLAVRPMMTEAQRERLGALMRARIAREAARGGRPGPGGVLDADGRREVCVLIESDVLAASPDGQRAAVRSGLEALVRRVAPEPLAFLVRLGNTLGCAALGAVFVGGLVGLVGWASGSVGAALPAAAVTFVIAVGLMLPDLVPRTAPFERRRALARDLADAVRPYEEDCPTSVGEAYRLALQHDPRHPDRARLRAFVAALSGGDADDAGDPPA